jgi:hypothetical protein
MYQPWDDTGIREEGSETVIFDRFDGEEIVRIPGRHMPEKARLIYNTIRMEFLRGYMQGAEDKVREVREVLNCRY